MEVSALGNVLSINHAHCFFHAFRSKIRFGLIICIHIFYACSVFNNFSHLNISLLNLASILEEVGLVVLAVDRLSPDWDLAPVQGSFFLLHVSPTSALYLTHIIAAKPGEVHQPGQHSRRACHELNTTRFGDLKRSERARDGKTTPSHLKTSTAGSRVMLLTRQQTPQAADESVCVCMVRRGGVLNRSCEEQ